MRDLVFISYSHEDRVWLDRLRIFLKPYIRSGTLRVWSDPHIKTGDRWFREIKQAMAGAHMGVLLVSSDFLASDFVAEEELPALLAAEASGLLKIFCVPVSSSAYDHSPISEFQWARDPESPLDLLGDAEWKRAMVEIARDLVALAGTAPQVNEIVQEKVVAERVVGEVRTGAALGALFNVPSLPPHYLAREQDLDRIKISLLDERRAAVGLTAHAAAVGLQGMGGIGKTVLANAAAHDDRVRAAFPDGVYWLSVGQEPNLLALQGELAKMCSGAAFEVDSIPQGVGELRNRLAGRACLLVLDDVWRVEDARAFDALDVRAALLMTTRDSTILTALSAHEECVDLLSDEQALRLLAEWSGWAREDMPANDAACLVEECGRLPLALSLAGAQVRDGTPWATLVGALRAGKVDFLDHPYGSVFSALQLSLAALEEEERERYQELAAFPEDMPVPESVIAGLWAHSAGMQEYETNKLLSRFAGKSLLTLSSRSPRNVSFHDLQLDFLRLVAGDLRRRHAAVVEAARAIVPAARGEPPRWANLSRESSYLWSHLAFHLAGCERFDELRALFTDVQWLRGRMRGADVQAPIADCQLLPGDEVAELVGETLRQEAHWLRQDDLSLAPLLFGAFVNHGGAPGDDPPLLFDSSELPMRQRHPIQHSKGRNLWATLTGHAGWVMACAVTADGKRGISGSDDNTLKVWNLETGEEEATLRGHDAWVRACAVTADGKRAVSGSYDKTLKVWNLETGETEATLRGHAGLVFACAVTADGKRAVSGSTDKTLKVWDLETEEEEATLRGHAGPVTACALTADGKRAVSGSEDNTLKVWNLETGEEEATLRGHAGVVMACAMTADGKRAVSGSDDHRLKVWNLETGEEEATLREHPGWVMACAVTADGIRAVSGSDDKTLKVWNLATEEEKTTLRGHAGWVLACLITADGKRAVSGSTDKTLKVWDLETGEEEATLRGHTDWVRACAVTADGQRVVSGSEDNTLKVWNLETGEEEATLPGPADSRRVLAVTADGKRAVSRSNDKTLKLWNLETGEEEATLRGHADLVMACAVTADGKRAVSGSSDNTLKVWNLETGEEEATLRGHAGWVFACAVTADGKRAVSGAEDRTLRLWDLASGRQVGVVYGDAVFSSVAIAGDTVCAGDSLGNLWTLGLFV